MDISPAELNRNCQLPGVEGALWRLLRSNDPDKVVQWLQQERKKGLPAEEAITIVAQVMAGMAFSLVQGMNDKQGALFGERGLFKQTETIARRYMDQVGGQIMAQRMKVPTADEVAKILRKPEGSA